MKKAIQDRKKITIKIDSELLERIDYAVSKSSFSTRQDFIGELLKIGLDANKFNEAISKLDNAVLSISHDRQETRMEIKQLSNRINHAIDTLNKKIDDTLTKQNSEVFDRMKAIQYNEVIENEKYKKALCEIIDEMGNGRILERMVTLASGIIKISYILQSLSKHIIEKDSNDFNKFISEAIEQSKKYMEEKGIFGDKKSNFDERKSDGSILNLSAQHSK